MKRWSLFAVCFLSAALVGGYFVGPLLHGQVQRPVVFPKELTSYRDVVKQVLPAVVSIETEKTIPVARRQVVPKTPQFDESQVPEEFRRFFKDFKQPFKDFDFEMPERAPVGFGSGFIVDPSGVIMTNYHVVAGATKVVVQLADGRKFESTDIRHDRKTDLAVVRIDTKGAKLPTLDFGDSDAMEIGDRVLAFGAPFGLRGSVTSGIVSAKGRNGLNMNMYEDFLQTDAAINPGNSGGPLINLEGKVIGINAAIKSRSGGFNGVGLAIASNLARQVKDALVKDGVVHRGYLGVQVRDLAPEVAKSFGLAKDQGVVVAKVFENTPAAKAGIVAGDVILSLGDRKINDGKTLQSAVTSMPLNKSSSVEIYREGKRIPLTITIEEQPQDFGLAQAPLPRSPSRKSEAKNLDKIGVEIENLTPELAKELGYDATQKGGVVISSLEPNSIGARAGLQRGMLILKVNNQPVANAESAQQLLAAGSLTKGVILQVQSPQGGVNFVYLQSQSE